MSTTMHRIRTTALLAIAVVPAACGTVHPVRFSPPPSPKTFISEVEVNGAAPHPEPTTERATESPVWWSAFADPVLDSTIQEALRNNYFIRDVRTLIYEDMLDPTIPQGWWWPLQIGIPATTPANIQHAVAVVAGNPASKVAYNIANIDLTASYQVDLFGNIQTKREIGINLAEQQRQNTEMAVQNLAAQVSQLWFDILVERALKELTLIEVKYNQELYDLIKARFDQHLVTRLVVLQQEQQLLNIQSQVPLVVAQIAILNSQLTGLLGRTPNPRDDLIPTDRRLPDLPPDPNLGAPVDLNDTTAELRFAKLRVTEIEHRVNQNLSSWLPTIEVVGSYGVASFGGVSQSFSESFGGLRLTWPLFDGGRRITEAKQLELTLERRHWQYELAIKTAVGRVQDALLQEKNQAESLRSLTAQVELGQRLLAEARRLFEQGQSDYLPVLTALSNLSSLQRDALRAQRLLLSYRVQLYRALGGTWSYAVTKLPDKLPE